MAKAKGRLLASLAVEKGVDFKKVVEKRKQKEARREKRKAGIAVDDKPQPAKKQKKEEKPVGQEESEDDEDFEDVEDEEEDSEEDDYDMAELLDREAVESDEEEDEDEDEGVSYPCMVCYLWDLTLTVTRSTFPSSNTTRAPPTPR
jgi:hypothetical protein